MRDPVVCIDIETSGPVPSPYSMLSIGGVSVDAEKLEPMAEFHMNLEPFWGFPDSMEGFVMHQGYCFDPDTWAWWQTQPASALQEALRDPQPARGAMRAFVDFVRGAAAQRRPERPAHGSNDKPYNAVLLAKPATFDGSFVNHYAITAGYRFENLPWKHRVMDLSSWIAGIYGVEYHQAHKKTQGLAPSASAHDALEDARLLAGEFIRIETERRNLVGN